MQALFSVSSIVISRAFRSLDGSVSAVVAMAAFIAIAAIIQVMQPDLAVGVWVSRTLIFASLYFLLFLLVFSHTPWVSASCWLGIPVLLFAATWLRSWLAWPLVGLISASLFLSIRSNCRPLPFSRFDALPGALLVLFWVSLSGAGGYGFQNSDYVLHNGRLIDLIENAWPVIYQQGTVLTRPEYSDRHLLVLYSGYYILAALFGKFAGIQGAMDFMHCWTLVGCWIALRFLQQFSGMRSALIPSLLMIGCGGWDFVGVLGSWLLQGAKISWEMLATGLQQIWHLAQTPVWLDFWAGSLLVDFSLYHFGNFLSLTAELFWAPHHTIAGWLSIALLYEAWKSKNCRFAGFNGALLTFFSPLMSIVVLPFIVVMALQLRKFSWSLWVSLPNVTGIVVATVFFLYYWGGSASANPMGFVVLKDVWPSTGFLIYFYFFSWGVYALACRKNIKNMPTEKKYFFITSFFLFAVLPLFRYGLWNDLMVRSSGILYFCIVLLLLDSMKFYLLSGHRLKVALLVFISLLSWPSAILNFHTSIKNMGYQEPSQRVVDYWDGWEELGSLNSFFAKYFLVLPSSLSRNAPDHRLDTR